METAWNWHGVSLLERNSPRRHGREMEMRAFLRVAIPHQLKKKTRFRRDLAKHLPSAHSSSVSLSTRPAVVYMEPVGTSTQ